MDKTSKNQRTPRDSRASFEADDELPTNAPMEAAKEPDAAISSKPKSGHRLAPTDSVLVNSAKSGGKLREERLAQALRANLRRRKQH